MGEEAARPKETIFVSDPSAEAEQIAASLRARGYVVVDVPLAMLHARAAVQRPRIVIVDADADGAYPIVMRLRELPDADAIDVLFLGRSSEASAEVVEDRGSFFARPVDLEALHRRIETLTSEDVPPPPNVRHPSAPVGQSSVRPSAGALPPPSIRSRSSVLPPPPPSVVQAPVATRASQPPPSTGLVSRRSMSPALSNELLALLAEAEERALTQQGHSESTRPSPEEEIEAVLPTELLAALDEPLEEPEEEEDEADRGRHTTSSGGRKHTTGASSRNDLEGGRELTSEEVVPEKTQQPTLPPPRARDSAPAPILEQLLEMRASESSIPPPATTASPSGNVFAQTISSDALAQMLGMTAHGQPPSLAQNAPPPPSTDATLGDRSITNHGPSSVNPTGVLSTSPGTSAGAPPIVSEAPRPDFAEARVPPPAPLPAVVLHSAPIAVSAPPPIAGSIGGAAPLGAAPPFGLSVAPPVGAEAVLGPGDALNTLARAVATRISGSLSFEADGGLRRVVMREGDLVTCASSLAEESLLAFLEGRGDLPKDRADGLAGRVPAFGRHAGAALVAHGILRQDQLWPVLRSHAEWILGKTIGIERGVFVREGEAPGRLKGEPSVFGGSTGAEVLVEVARRVVSARDAATRLGGPPATFAVGANDALLVECALDERETHFVRSVRGHRLEEVIKSHGVDVTPLLYALTVMGVLEATRPVTAQQPALASVPDPLDEEAIVAKVQARLALVEEGDYFAILGLPHTATSYEIRRAFLDLRRTFEPARLLTPNLVHLAPELGKITVVLEEAFEILKDDVRRERYRRAIEGAPFGA